MRLRLSVSAIFALVAALVMGFAALFQGLGNPQVPRGASASFPSTGVEGPLGSEAWDVVNASSTVVAKASVPAGWTVTLSGSTFTVGAPAGAAVAANYKVRYGSGGGVEEFRRAAAGRAKARGARSLSSGLGNPWGGGVGAPQAGPVGPSPSGSRSAAFDVAVPPSPPAAPSVLTASAASSNTINLAWTDNSGNEAGFKVERKTGAAGAWAQVAAPAANATAYADAGLSSSTLYDYRLRATNASGDSAYSNEASAATPAPTPPAAPSGLSETALSGVGVRLAWTDGSNNEDGFRVYRHAGTTWPGDAGATLVATTLPNAASYVDPTVSPLTTYLYRVVAYNVAGSAGSNVASVSTPAGPPPGSAGPDFWLALPSNGPTFGGFVSTYCLYVTSESAATATVSIPGGTFSQTVSVAAGGSATVTLPADAELTAADGVAAKAIRVVANVPVGVQVLNYCGAASEGFTPIATPALGTRYVVASYVTGGATPDDSFNSLVAVVASQDATVVTVTPSQTVGSHPARVPFSVALNRGDAYQLKAGGQNADLTGTLVDADKPVQAISGDQGANVPSGVASANPLMEALPSVDRWGTQFVAAPYATRAGGDRLRVVAAYNDTKVFVDGAQVGLLARGAFLERELTAPSAISADKPVLVEQFAKGSASDGNPSADPFMTTVPALTQYVARAALNVPDATMMSHGTVSVVVPSAAVGDLSLDGVAVPAASFAAVGTSGYSCASFEAAPGAHVLSTPGTGRAFGAWVYGLASPLWPGAMQTGYDGFGYPAALALPTNGFAPATPSAPTALAATAVSTGAVSLAWTDGSTNERGFRVERRSASADWVQISVVGPNVATYADTGLTKATAYAYRVRAYADVDSAWSNEASATTFDTPPSAPTSPVATALSATEIDLAWADASNNETGFKVERRQGAGAYALVYTAGANATVFHDTGLIKKTAYAYRVTAKNAYGDSAPSPEASAATKDAPPAAPTGLAAVSPAPSRSS